ncbi:MAG TPA: hypothetical protein VLD60_10200, partial [Nitrospira sp.]|nr:hypothetical protein [Nitrospira sp.]
VTNIRNSQTQAYAPLAESLYEALCLYRKSQGPCYDNGTGTVWGTNYTNSTGTTGDPFFFTSYNQMVRCCKNYVLMISPGIGVADGTNPTLQTPFPTGSTINPTWTNNIGVKASTSAGDATSAAAGDRLDDVAYYGRTHDLRSDLTGSQYVTFYSVNAMGRKVGATLLASAAKYGGFNDQNNDGTSNFNPTSGQTCNYPATSNLNPGTAGPFYSDPEWDAHGPLPTDPPDCVPDTFFDANDGYGLRNQILAALDAILKNSASGTSISVLASSSNGDGSIYQAYFYPETPKGDGTANVVSWTGYFQGLFIDTFGNLREDHGGASGAGDGKLVYTDDNIVVTEVSPTTGEVVIRRYADADGDGKADDTGYYATPRTGGTVATLREMQGMWEAGKKLALRDLSAKPRNLFTWVDLNDDGVVTANEQMAFSTANAATLSPYLRATSTGTFTATNIISFLQGNQVTGMRDRQFPVDGVQKTWRLGDIVNSSPTIVGPPRERFDILYGDNGYRQYLQRWSNRRQTAYVGANDGMLHAFNLGYYHRADDPNTSALEHGWYTTAPSDNSSGPELGEELWGFVPHYILPQLMWYTQSNYTHISYVDLKPKVTDVRIFTPEAACGSSASPTPTATGCIHPDGWGTILIMGMRFGGSCGICASVSGANNGGPPLAVTADFGSGVTTRYFYSGYIVLDITDPDATPKVLSAFSNWGLGLTTSYPTVVRMSPKADGKNDHTNARWMMLLGSGVHGYDGRAAMYGSMFGVLLVQQGTSPSYVQMPMLDQASSPLTYKSSYMSDLITFDRDLDFRSDAVYGGRAISGGASCTGSGWSACGTGLGYWTGKMYRLTMGTCTSAPCSVMNWGVIDSGWLLPTEMVTAVPIAGSPVSLGPVTASSSVTLDSSGNTWIFFGTGRFMSNADKTDQHAQYLVGVKDSVMSGCTQSVVSSCHDENLLDVTNAAICVSCASGNQVQGVGSVSTFTGLTDKIQGNSAAGIPAMDGWVIQLASNSGSTTLGAERSIVSPTLIGGAVFFPTFTPSSDVCVAAGTSQIYGLYYLTGTGYPDPIFGVDASGQAVRAVNGGQGVASSVAIQIGSEPTGMSGYFQSSNSAINKITPKPPAMLWSQFMAWINQRV